MSGLILNLVAKKALKGVSQKNTNSKDPYFEEVAIYGRDGRPTGKVKKQKRAIPAGLSANDVQVLKKVRKRAYRLDMCLFSLFGLRFGWGSVVGLLPVIGDFLDAFFALNVVRTCGQVDGGLPHMIRSRMVMNIILDFGIGLVPVIGDLADAAYKANTRNTWLLQEYLVKKMEEEVKLQAKPASSTHRHDRASNNGSPLDGPVIDGPVLDRPQAAHTVSHESHRGGWFGFGSKTRQPDVEMATTPVPPNKQQQRR